ncbi:MAG: T9SS type A sorting domain-containing protein [Flavisolibacter sp.]
MVQKPQLKNWGLLFSLFFLVGIRYSSAQSFVHPGLSHKKSDLDRMKMMVAAGKEPWKSSFANLAQSPYASFNYVVRGSSSNTVLNQTISSEYNKIKFDGLAAYYNSLMWYITGDERYARKAVEIFNAWVNIRQFITDGTNALDAGRVIWKLLEGAEIIKCTYPGWQQSDIDKFKAMLVYPGYSTSQVPTDSIKSAHVTFYWYMYNGDPARHGNQGIFGMRGIMAMGVFLDNRTMYDRAFRYLTGQPHRADDLPYVSGPPIVSSTKASTSNQYFDEYTTISPYQQTTITDYGYDDQIQYYLDTNGQCEESSRDQSHPITGISILSTIAEMAWNQGDDLYGYLNNRILSGLEYEMRYNASLNYSYPDQASSWEPTVASGEYTSRSDRSGRWTSLKINPYSESDFTRLTRGANFKSNVSPFHELALAHYRDRLGLPVDNYKWTQRAYDISLNEFGYEGQGFEVDHPGFGGLTFHRTNLSPGDPVQSFTNGQPVYGMNNLPSTIEAENFDFFTTGGQGKTYNDSDNLNTGGAYRPSEGVDISTCSEGGYAVTNMQPGEWLNYTVSVPKTGFYKIAIRYSSFNANGQIRFDFDSVNTTGYVPVPFGGTNSTGANDWKDFYVDTVTLQAGVQSMRIYVGGTQTAFNLNNITVSAVDPWQAPATPISLVAKAGNKQVLLNWNPSLGALSYKVKRTTTVGGPYVTIATVDTSFYANTGLTNGTSYFYVVSASNAVGESANSAEASATPTDTGNFVEDDFQTELGSRISGRTPEVATISNRTFQPSFTGAATTNTVINGAAQLATSMGEVIDISTTDGFTKPTYINISGNFNEGTVTNNVPGRPARGVYFGFWTSLSSSTTGFQNMRGVFVNPEDGELHLWNGSGSSTDAPVQSIPYSGTWDPAAQHTVSYTINTATGNISDFLLDGITYLWNKTNIFLDANTNYAGFGISGSASGQYGNIVNFKVKDNKVWNEIVRTPQSINFPDLPDHIIGDADFTTNASTTSGLPVTLVSSNPSIATVNSDGSLHIIGIGMDTITAYQAGNSSYEAAIAVNHVLNITNNGNPVNRLLILDNFNSGDSVSNRLPDKATISGRAYQKSKSVSTAKNLIVNGAAQLYDNMGEAINISSSGNYTKPTYFNISDTFDLGTLANNSTPRAARGVYLGFWKSIPTSTSTSIDSYSQFYGVFVNPDGTLRMWNGKNKSDSTPVQTLPYIGTWSGGSTKHTLSYTINTTTGLMSNFVLDGVSSYAWKDTAIFTSTNTSYAGFGVSGAASTNYGNVYNFKLTNAAPQLSQSVSFPPILNRTNIDPDFNPQASASSSNPLTYTSSDTTVATISNGLIHITGVGTTTVTATQSGNADYSPASARQPLVVKTYQSISFDPLPSKNVGDADFNLTASASSGLPLIYSSSDTTVATIVNNNEVHIVKAGAVIITASQAGDATYAPAQNQSQTIAVTKPNQTITFDPMLAKHVGDADFDPGATSDSGLPISYTSADENVATIVNGQVHIVAEGTIVVTASQPGDSKYTIANSVSQTLTVTRQNQTITFNTLSPTQMGSTDINPAATASSGLPVIYTSSDSSVAIIVNGMIHIVGKGTTTITATQAGNANYKAATPISQQFTVYIPPTVKTRNVQLQLDKNGNVNLTPQMVDDGSVSYSGSLSLALDKSAFTCSDVASPVTITLTATDADGHASTGTAQITVLDNVPPSVSAPANQFFCFAGTTYQLPLLQASDNCGVSAVTYSITGATARGGSGNDASGIFNAGTSIITWTVVDVHNNTSTSTTTVVVNPPLSANIPDVYALNAATDSKNTIYIGYGPSSLTVTATAAGGMQPYMYQWNTGQTTQSINVNLAATYSVIATDSKGCATTTSTVIRTLDVTCGNNSDKVMVCHNGKTICVASSAVQDHLSHGDALGACTTSITSNPLNRGQTDVTKKEDINIYPNPVRNYLSVSIASLQTNSTLRLFNANGSLVYSRSITNFTTEVPVQNLAAGIYYLQVTNGNVNITKKIFKE